MLVKEFWLLMIILASASADDFDGSGLTSGDPPDVEGSGASGGAGGTGGTGRTEGALGAGGTGRAEGSKGVGGTTGSGSSSNSQQIPVTFTANATDLMAIDLPARYQSLENREKGIAMVDGLKLDTMAKRVEDLAANVEKMQTDMKLVIENGTASLDKNLQVVKHDLENIIRSLSIVTEQQFQYMDGNLTGLLAGMQPAHNMSSSPLIQIVDFLQSMLEQGELAEKVTRAQLQPLEKQLNQLHSALGQLQADSRLKKFAHNVYYLNNMLASLKSELTQSYKEHVDHLASQQRVKAEELAKEEKAWRQLSAVLKDSPVLKILTDDTVLAELRNVADKFTEMLNVWNSEKFFGLLQKIEDLNKISQSEKKRKEKAPQHRAEEIAKTAEGFEMLQLEVRDLKTVVQSAKLEENRIFNLIKEEFISFKETGPDLEAVVRDAIHSEFQSLTYGGERPTNFNSTKLLTTPIPTATATPLPTTSTTTLPTTATTPKPSTAPTPPPTITTTTTASTTLTPTTTTPYPTTTYRSTTTAFSRTGTTIVTTTSISPTIYATASTTSANRVTTTTSSFPTSTPSPTTFTTTPSPTTFTTTPSPTTFTTTPSPTTFTTTPSPTTFTTKLLKGVKQDCESEPERLTEYCENFSLVWYFNTKEGRCDRYRVCNESIDLHLDSDRSNRFTSETSCQQYCVEPGFPNACSLPFSPGICIGKDVRWFYNSVTGNCAEFEYSGCLGNQNRFLHRAECLEKCEVPHKNFTENQDEEAQRPNLQTTPKLSRNNQTFTTERSTTFTTNFPLASPTPSESDVNHVFPHPQVSASGENTRADSYGRGTGNRAKAETASGVIGHIVEDRGHTQMRNPQTNIEVKTSRRERNSWRGAERESNNIRKYGKHSISGSYVLEVKMFGPKVVEFGSNFELVCELKQDKKSGDFIATNWEFKENMGSKYWMYSINDKISILKVFNYTKPERFRCLADCPTPTEQMWKWAPRSVCAQNILNVHVTRSCDDKPSVYCQQAARKGYCRKSQGLHFNTACCKSCLDPESYLPKHTLNDFNRSRNFINHPPSF